MSWVINDAFKEGFGTSACADSYDSKRAALATRR